MAHVKDMLKTHPQAGSATLFNQDALLRCLQACQDCGITCTTCADACLAEDMVKQLVTCIRLNLDCAVVCETTASLLGRAMGGSVDVLRAQLVACREACRACGMECERHAKMHEHCRVCAEACRSCAEACDALLAG